MVAEQPRFCLLINRTADLDIQWAVRFAFWAMENPGPHFASTDSLSSPGMSAVNTHMNMDEFRRAAKFGKTPLERNSRVRYTLFTAI